MQRSVEQAISRPAILSIGTSNPPLRYSQQEVYDLAAQYSDFYRNRRIEQIFLNSDIDFRHLDLDIATFKGLESVDELHVRYKRASVEIGGEAIRRCLKNGGWKVEDIDCIIAVSCTGYLCPGLCELLIKKLSLRNNIQRADLIGMGCAGALPGLQRAYDFVSAYPDRKALVITVEICSACYYLDDSLETVVGNAICADGAAAVLVGMSADDGVPKIVAFDSHLEPSMIETVGFEQRQGLLRIVLAKDIRDLAGGLSCRLISRLLATHKLTKEDVGHWILHSGGRKVIDSMQQEIGLTPDQVRHSKHVLRNFGNMSSPTVLFVLDEALKNGNPKPGDRGVMLALGPGLAVESALLEW